MSQAITYDITPGDDERWDSIFSEFPEIERIVEFTYGMGEDEVEIDVDIHLRDSPSNPFSLQEFIPGTPMRSAIERLLDELEEERGV